MSHPRRIVAALLAAGFLAVPPVAGRETEAAPPDRGSVADQLDRLNATLARIAELLERQAEGQRLELALKRVELANRRVESVEAELANTRSQRSSLQDNLSMVDAELESLASQAERSEPDDLPAVEEQVREAQRAMEILKGRMEDRDRSILELENELARRRRDLEVLQDRLDRELDGL